MEKDFIIDQVSWHTHKDRNFEINQDLIYSYFKGIMTYLQIRGLATKPLIQDATVINDNTRISSGDLTEEGLLLMKKAYGKWVDGIMDKGKNPFDYKTLDNALNKIRNK
ncbi:hypothetical protein [Flavisolibacter nicotianae]|uniref:hypothetical protein n=1 Tax=Flavisolibacter nicotianae TaxID=2364882 RepID=UPI000EB2B3D5|nr:hypothetical protein [Flavisolibacter nicotianae]